MNLIEHILFVSLAVAACFALLQEFDHRLTKAADKDPVKKRARKVIVAFLAAGAACFLCQTVYANFGETLQIMFNVTPDIQRDRVQVFTDKPNF